MLVSGSSMTLVSALLLLGTGLPAVNGEAFLGGSHQGRPVKASLDIRSEELQAALGAVLGCGAASEVPRNAAIRQILLPLWQTLPKNPHGRVSWKLVRYVTHRHFMQRFGILVRGLEPSIEVNASRLGEAEILSHQAPQLAQQLKEGPQAEHGFSLEDTVAMLAALEQLLFGSEATLLEKVYRDRGLDIHAHLSRQELQNLLMDYMVHWMNGDDEETAYVLIKNPLLLLESIPHWHAITDMVHGSVRALEYARQQRPQPGTAHSVFSLGHSFEDALEVAGGIGRNFAFFWESQCADIKDSLVVMDKTRAGRVRLPDFYGANKDGEWRFGESEAYLRELGALDETSVTSGKQVVIPNYLQAASNCIVTRPHYLVCCMNECEDVLGHVEASVGAPVAAVEDLLLVVGNMTDSEDEAAPVGDATLRGQLLRIAEAHGGKVPLHGRLFAQWLHYVFPRECPFPHKAGIAAALTPTQFGGEFAVSAEEVQKHVADDIVKRDLGGSGSNASGAETWMTQWSEEEELLVDYSKHLREPWHSRHLLALGGAAATVLGMFRLSHAKSEGPATARPSTHFV